MDFMPIWCKEYKVTGPDRYGEYMVDLEAIAPVCAPTIRKDLKKGVVQFYT